MLSKFLLFILCFVLTCVSLAADTHVLYKQGVELIRQKRYDEAIAVLEAAIENRDVPNQAPIYYFIGVALYLKKDYENSITMLETALDVSRNTTLDNRVERYIDKVIRQQNFEASISKKHIFSYFLGVGYDSNILKLNADDFSGTSLAAVSALYGAGYSYRLLQTPEYSFIPGISFSDSYAVNNKLQGESTIQSTDAMQLGARLPFQYLINYSSASDAISLEASYAQVYLPVESNTRTLAFETTQFQLGVSLGLTKKYTLNPIFYYAIDKSKIDSASPDDNQSAKRSGALINNKWLVGSDNVFSNLSGELNQAEGRNQVYGKLGLEAGYDFLSEISRLRLAGRYATVEYGKRDDVRKDSLTGLRTEWTRNLSATSSLTISLAYEQNDSNIHLNQYNDISLSAVFSDVISF